VGFDDRGDGGQASFAARLKFALSFLHFIRRWSQQLLILDFLIGHFFRAQIILICFLAVSRFPAGGPRNKHIDHPIVVLNLRFTLYGHDIQKSFASYLNHLWRKARRLELLAIGGEAAPGPANKKQLEVWYFFFEVCSHRKTGAGITHGEFYCICCHLEPFKNQIAICAPHLIFHVEGCPTNDLEFPKEKV
jgi:hypothetical protein